MTERIHPLLAKCAEWLTVLVTHRFGDNYDNIADVPVHSTHVLQESRARKRTFRYIDEVWSVFLPLLAEARGSRKPAGITSHHIDHFHGDVVGDSRRAER